MILAGPYPTPKRVGGYARCNELMATSFLDERFGIERLAVTVPDDGHLAGRMLEDLRRTRHCLARVPAPIFHLTAQYHRGTLREWAQYRMARRARRAFVFDIRGGCFVDCFAAPGTALYRPLLRAMIEGASAVTVEGRSQQAWLAHEFGREALWLPNFVQAAHAERFPRAPLATRGPGEALRVSYAGSVAPGKGLEALVEAASRLTSEGVPIEVHLAGPVSDAYRATLEGIAAPRGTGGLVFHGILEHGELLALLASTHVFVYASSWHGEGHSNAVNEAMQVGLPVVTTRHGFLAEVVTPDCGILLESDESPAIAQALRALAADDARLRAMGAAGRARVYAEFSDVVVLERLASLYDRLLRDEAPAE